jgi:hypothetical protein
MLKVLGSIPIFLFHFLTSLLHRGKLFSRPLFHFLTSLPQRTKTMLKTSISFFNEIFIEKKNYAQGSGFNRHIFVSFFNEIAT